LFPVNNKVLKSCETSTVQVQTLTVSRAKYTYVTNVHLKYWKAWHV